MAYVYLTVYRIRANFASQDLVRLSSRRGRTAGLGLGTEEGDRIGKIRTRRLHSTIKAGLPAVRPGQACWMELNQLSPCIISG